MQILPASLTTAPLLARLIAEANRDVAVQFHLTRENCPKHPSFCEPAWIEADTAHGESYFIAYLEEKPVGCVAVEFPRADTAYLNRLAVLPAYRRQGIGAALIRFVLDLAQQRGVQRVSIGIIGKSDKLQHWYEALGFVPGESKCFAHLPFSVRYMAFHIKTA